MAEMKFGIVSDIKPGFAKVSFAEDGIVSGWLHVCVRKSLTDKDSWTLEVNEHVVCMVDDNCEIGVVLSAIYNDVDQPASVVGAGIFNKTFSDGTAITYNKNTHELKASVVGSAKITATTTIEADALVMATIQAPAIKLIGAVMVQGVITAGGLSITPMAGVPNADGLVHGDIKVTGTVTGQTDVVSGAISLKMHKHGGVQPGGGLTLVAV